MSERMGLKRGREIEEKLAWPDRRPLMIKCENLTETAL